jgi:hypothetical protein
LRESQQKRLNNTSPPAAAKTHIGDNTQIIIQRKSLHDPQPRKDTKGHEQRDESEQHRLDTLWGLHCIARGAV